VNRTWVSITMAAALVLGAATAVEGSWCSCWCECVRNFTPQGTPLCEGSGSCCTGMRPGFGEREGCRCAWCFIMFAPTQWGKKECLSVPGEALDQAVQGLFVGAQRWGGEPLQEPGRGAQSAGEP